MPHITVQITKEGTTTEQKRKIIRGATDLMTTILGKDPILTHVVIEEVETDDWGVAGSSVTDRRAGEEVSR